MRHRLGDKQKDDVEIYRETDSGWFVGLDITQDDRYGFISIHDHETSEVLLLDLDDAAETPVPVFPREQGVEYEIDHHAGELIIRTNHGGAADFKIIALPVGETDLARGGCWCRKRRDGCCSGACAEILADLVQPRRGRAAHPCPELGERGDTGARAESGGG